MLLKYRYTLVLLFGFLLQASAQEIISRTDVHMEETTQGLIFQGGLFRDFSIYIPAGYNGVDPMPLMFNFHGYTQTVSEYMKESCMMEVADKEGFILVFPQGTLLEGNTHWNVGSWTKNSKANDVAFVERMIEMLTEVLPIDSTRIYACGFSNGGFFSFELACQLSDKIAAIGAVSATMTSETFDKCAPTRPVPVVTIHGTLDEIARYAGGYPVWGKSMNQVNDYWKAVNKTDEVPFYIELPDISFLDHSHVDYYAYNNGKNCTSVEHYRVVGGKHSWPRHDGNPDKVNVDINGCQVIWDFVSKYDINGLREGCQGQEVHIAEAHESSNEVLRVFPNPARNAITVDTHTEKPIEYSLHSLTGRLLLTGTVSKINNQIDISGLPNNMYILSIGNKTTKIVKSS